MANPSDDKIDSDVDELIEDVDDKDIKGAENTHKEIRNRIIGNLQKDIDKKI